MVSISSDDLLHPEILSRESLVSILSQRQIKLDHAQRLNKETLVEIFHRTVTPLAQRVPRLNRRGKVTAKKIKRLSGQRTFRHDEKQGKLQSEEKVLNSNRGSQKGGLITSAHIASSKPRLKPPPVVINKNRGIIKLSTSSSSKKSHSTPVEDAQVKKSHKSPSRVSFPTSPPKVIRLSDSKSTLEGNIEKISLKSPEATLKSTKKISLKRPSSEVTTGSVSPSESAKSSSTSPSSGKKCAGASPNKKLKKITWP